MLRVLTWCFDFHQKKPFWISFFEIVRFTLQTVAMDQFTCVKFPVSCMPNLDPGLV